jgi:hypothetical protein
MEDAAFKTMIQNLDAMIDDGEKIESQYNEGTWGDGLLGDARALQGKMDKVMQSELCHVIGMGHLTVSQNMQFVKRIQDLGKFRPVVKAIASLPAGSDKMPNIKASEYHSVLTETVLTGGK